MSLQPPKYSLKFLRWFCKDDYLEEIEGNLWEIFDVDSETSPNRARRRFTWNVIRHFRPAFIRSFSTEPTNYRDMLRHNTLLAFRNFKKYSGSFAINLVGLSTGIACAILLYLWVGSEVSMDKFHENDSRIFQVMQNLVRPGDTLTISSTPGILADALKEELPEVEYAASVIPTDWFENPEGIVGYEDQFVQAKGQLVQPDYLKIFSWEITQGNPDQVLADRNSMVISEELAIKLFGSTDAALGKALQWDQGVSEGTYQVSGLFKTPPSNSTQQFDVLLNYDIFYQRRKEQMDKWSNSDPDTYVLLREGSSKADFDAKLKNFARDKFEAINGPEYLHYVGVLFSRKFSDGYLYNSYDNGQQAGGRISYVKLFSVIAIFILGIACINFINLTTARASRRAKEIGVKKAIGAKRGSLVNQFLIESLLVTAFSMVLGLVLVFILLPAFNALTGKAISLGLDLILPVIGITVIVSFLAGLYPAIYLSGFKPVGILKANVIGKTVDGFSTQMVRKGLVVFQFSISVVLIIAVVVVYNQMELIQTKKLGYNDENVVALKSSGKLYDEMETFVQELKKVPGVINASPFGHDMVGDYGGTTGVAWPGQLPDEKIRFGNLEVGHDWIELLDIELLDGRTYTDNYLAEEDNIIFNKTAIEAMGLEDPVGQTVRIWGKDRLIIGVVDDFNFASLYEDVAPLFIQLYPDLSTVLIKVDGQRTAETLAQIEDFHTEFNDGLPFDYTFMDDDYQRLYESEQRVSVLSRYFAVVAILISSLGLLALAAFTTERRQKEIGIRKVMGSSAIGIVALLSSDFIKMVLIAIMIATPISYWFAEEWLSSFAFRIDLSWWYFALSGGAALLIAGLTVSLQTLKAAFLNPVLCLKDE